MSGCSRSSGEDGGGRRESGAAGKRGGLSERVPRDWEGVALVVWVRSYKGASHGLRFPDVTGRTTSMGYPMSRYTVRLEWELDRRTTRRDPHIPSVRLCGSPEGCCVVGFRCGCGWRDLKRCVGRRLSRYVIPPLKHVCVEVEDFPNLTPPSRRAEHVDV